MDEERSSSQEYSKTSVDFIESKETIDSLEMKERGGWDAEDGLTLQPQCVGK
jgi:hypothetical protein